jgi:hypothetical protein
MIYTVKLKLKSPVLGIVRSHTNKYRTLMRTGSNRVVIPQPHWHWGVHEALTTLSLKETVSQDCFRDLIPYEAPSTHAYTRTVGKREDMYEAVRTGVVVTTQLVITELPSEEKDKPIGTRKRPPDLKDIQSVLRFTGAFVGITQWGYKFGYGRFSLESLTVATPEEVQEALNNAN